MLDLGRDESHERANRERPLTERVSRRVDTVAEDVGAWLRRHLPESVVQGLQRPYKAVFSTGVFRFHGYTSAEVVTDRAIKWLDANGDDEFFLWIHYMEVHRPFGVHDDPAYLDGSIPDSEIRDLLKKVNLRPDDVTDAEHQTLVDLYDSDVRYCSRLFDHLEAAGLWDTTNVLFSSDHGEEFGEHGSYGHRNYPYDELVHVPLVVRRVGGGGSAAVDGQRELVDLLPTISGFHGVDPSPNDPAGRDLLADTERDVLLLGQPKDLAPAAGIRRDGWKYVHAGEDRLLYDLEADPGETVNVAPANPAVVDELAAAILDSLIKRDATELRDPKEAADRERLAALGYLERE